MTVHTCDRCGREWRTGENGNHDCAKYAMRALQQGEAQAMFLRLTDADNNGPILLNFDNVLSVEPDEPDDGPRTRITTADGDHEAHVRESLEEIAAMLGLPPKLLACKAADRS